MNYEVISHQHQNTGGNCTVSSIQLYDRAKNRTLFVLLNDDSASLSTADYISADIEFSNDMLIETVSFETLTKTHGNFELYRYCLNEYIKEDCKYFKNTVYVRYDLLSDQLLQLMTDEYIEWVNTNLGGAFETDGQHIIYDFNWLHPETGKINQSSINALTTFRKAFYKLEAALQQDDCLSERIVPNYPFDKDFYELQAQVTAWCDSLLEDADR